MRSFLAETGVTFAFLCWCGILAQFLGDAPALSAFWFLLFAALSASIVGAVVAFTHKRQRSE